LQLHFLTPSKKKKAVKTTGIFVNSPNSNTYEKITELDVLRMLPHENNFLFLEAVPIMGNDMP